MMSLVCDQKDALEFSPCLAGWDTNSRSDHPDRETLTLVLLAGFAGAGKTTLANRLHQKLSWEVLSKDQIQWHLMKKLNLSRLLNLAEKKKTGLDAFEVLFDLIETRIVSQRKSIIIDTCGYPPFILERIQAMCARSDLHVCLKVIVCNADKETRTRRLMRRGSIFEPFYHDLPEILEDSESVARFRHLPEDRANLDTTVPVEAYDRHVSQKALDYITAIEHHFPQIYR